jgi:hypothetical protein
MWKWMRGLVNDGEILLSSIVTNKAEHKKSAKLLEDYKSSFKLATQWERTITTSDPQGQALQKDVDLEVSIHSHKRRREDEPTEEDFHDTPPLKVARTESKTDVHSVGVENKASLLNVFKRPFRSFFNWFRNNKNK